MNLHSFLILAVGVALALGLRFLLKSRLWGLALFMAIVGTGAALLYWPGAYTPKDRLPLGIDLAGGTTLIYDVQVPAGKTASEVVDTTIATLSKRVDPSGTRNLVWKRLGDKRILVQMPAPNPKTAQLRETWRQAREAAVASSLSSDQLQDSLAKGIAPPGAEATLAAFKARAAAKATKDTAESAWKKLGDAKYDAYLAAENAYSKAKKAYAAAEAETLHATAFKPARLDKLCDLSNAADEGSLSRRTKALADLKAEYPTRAAALDTAMNAYGAYEKVKGELETPEDLDRLIQGSGRVEFRIAPRADDQDLGDPTPFIRQLHEKGPRSFGEKPYAWFEIDSLEQFLDITDDKKNADQLASAGAALGLPTEGLSADRVLRSLADALDATTDDRNAARAKESEAKILRLMNRRAVVSQVYGGKVWVLLGNNPKLNAMLADQGWALKNPGIAHDQFGSICVSFSMDAKGADLLGNLTGAHVNRMMAVLLDDRILTTPNLRSQLRDGGQITGNYSDRDVKYLVDTMRAGSLEGRISGAPVSQKTTGPELGADNLTMGLSAAAWAFGIVGAFMIFYYFIPGITANIALVANLLIILGVMAIFNATFTMPGIAGMVLTIGMAVDANVLIYERIREELGHGKDMRQAIHDGHHRSFATIFDSHVTQLLVAWVLAGCPPFNWVETPADLRGFAVTLGIGILASLFTALFGAYVFLDLFLWVFKPKKLHMLPTVIPGLQRALTPKIKWVQLSKFFVPITVVVCAASIGLAVWRGSDLLDVEFRSGSQVGFRLKKEADGSREQLTLENVRERIEEAAKAANALQKGLPVADAHLAERLKPVVKAAKARHEDAKREFEAKHTSVLEPEADFAQLTSEYLIGVGKAAKGADGKAATYGEFGLKTLLTDAKAVTDVVQVAMNGDLDAEPPVSFAGAAKSAKEDVANLLPITSGNLGELLKRDLPQGVAGDARDFIGGIVVVVDHLKPALSTAQLQDRLSRMRNQPPFDKQAPRRFKVVPLTHAGTTTQGQAETKTYSAFAVLAADGQTSYAADQSTLFAKDGLAVTQRDLVQAALQRASAFEDVTVFGSQVSGTMASDARLALLLSFFGIAGYVWFRFNALRYGLATIVALLHDVCIALGAVALSGLICNTAIGHALGLHDFKINLAMVAALLTVMGYSVNDTIVVFDRIREHRSKLKVATAEHINDAINETLSRTLLTSGTVIVSSLILYVVGGPAIHGFAFATLIGVLTGTWSSIAIASPLLLLGTGGKGLSMEKDESELADARLQPSAPGEPVGV